MSVNRTAREELAMMPGAGNEPALDADLNAWSPTMLQCVRKSQSFSFPIYSIPSN